MPSVRSTILDAVVAALNNITVANGYNTDLGITGTAQKLLVETNQLATFPMALVSMYSEDKELTRAESYVNRLRFTAAVLPQLNDGDEAETVLELLIADVEKAVMAANVLEPPLGLEAVTNIELLGHTKNTPEGEISALVDFVVIYRHSISDPSVAA